LLLGTPLNSEKTPRWDKKKGPDFKQLRFCSDFEGIGTFGTKIGIVHGLQILLEIGMVVSHSEHTIHWMPVMAQLWMNLNSVSIWFHLGNQFCKK
jgi:hypothetical protein